VAEDDKKADRADHMPLDPTLGDVKRELARNYRDYVADRIDGSDARCRKEQLLALKDVMATTELEMKLAEIERLIEQKPHLRRVV
jgi:hypothetical protein